MSGCGIPVKGSHKNDDSIPCGTKLIYGLKVDERREEILLCIKCKLREGL
jgi:hypothetical protein